MATVGCSPGIVPCMPGFRWDSALCRCVNYTPVESPPASGPPLPAPIPPSSTPFYKRPIVLLAAAGVALYFLMKK